MSKMTAPGAARQVLTEAEEPLHSSEITTRVLAAGLWKMDGKTPEATICAKLATDIKRKGSTSAFQRTAKGTLQP